MTVLDTLQTALKKNQDRVYLLRLERDLVGFLKSAGKVPQFVIMSDVLINSYYRLLSHQLCQYYSLIHINGSNGEILVSLNPQKDYLEIIGPNCKFQPLSQLYQETITTVGEVNDSRPLVKVKPKMLKKRDTSTATQNNVGIEQQLPVPGVNINGTNEIESERASKEALYNKIREQIFQDGESEEDENDDDEGEYGNYEQNSSKTGFKNMNRGTHAYQNYIRHNQNNVPYMPPFNQFQPLPSISGAGITSHTSAYAAPQQQEYFRYDPETERKILNNPYIIVPDRPIGPSGPSGPSGQYEQQVQPTRQYQQLGQGQYKQYQQHTPSYRPHSLL